MFSSKLKKLLIFMTVFYIFILLFSNSVLGIELKTGVAIPGFSEKKVQDDTIAKYVSAFYKWLVAAIAVFAVLMIVNAGLGMILNSGNVAKVVEKKGDLFRAILGLIFALVAVPMLSQINPILTKLSSLTVHNYQGEEFNLEQKTELPPVSDPNLVCPDVAEHNCGEIYRQTIEGREIACCGAGCPQGEACTSVTGGDPLGGKICPPGSFVYRVCQKTNNPQCTDGQCSIERKCDQTCCGGTKLVPCYCPKGEACPCSQCDPILSCVGVMCE